MSELKKCRYCGEFLEEGSDFCPKCGRVNAKADMSAEDGEQNGKSGNNFDFSDKIAKLMGDNHTFEFDHDDIEKNKTISALAYIPILFFLPLVACQGSKFGRFHANQGLLVLIFSVLSSTLIAIVNIFYAIPVPFIGIFLGIIVTILSMASSVATFGLFLYGLINTLNGRAFELPVIGKITLIK